MPSVTVVGSVNLDLVAECWRLPQPGETVIATAWGRYPGGKGANQALAASRSGSRVSLVAAVGGDGFADEALRLLRDDGLDLSALETVDHPTGVALIAVDGAGENQIVVVPGANHHLRPDRVDTGGADVVLCQLEVPLDAVLAAARTATGLFCLNAAPARELPPELLERVDVLIVNETERDILSDSLSDLGALVVLTVGAAGAKAFRSGRLVAEAQPPPVEVVDTVGAGDAFCGALATSLGGGASVGSALQRACAAGALATTKKGAQPSLPTADEIDGALRP